MNKYFSGPVGNAKPWSNYGGRGRGVESRLSMTTMSSPEAEAVGFSTKWGSPTIIWRSVESTIGK